MEGWKAAGERGGQERPDAPALLWMGGSGQRLGRAVARGAPLLRAMGMHAGRWAARAPWLGTHGRHDQDSAAKDFHAGGPASSVEPGHRDQPVALAALTASPTPPRPPGPRPHAQSTPPPSDSASPRPSHEQPPADNSQPHRRPSSAATAASRPSPSHTSGCSPAAPCPSRSPAASRSRGLAGSGRRSPFSSSLQQPPDASGMPAVAGCLVGAATAWPRAAGQWLVPSPALRDACHSAACRPPPQPSHSPVRRDASPITTQAPSCAIFSTPIATRRACVLCEAGR